MVTLFQFLQRKVVQVSCLVVFCFISCFFYPKIADAHQTVSNEFEQGIIQMQQGHYQEALQSFTEAIEQGKQIDAA